HGANCKNVGALVDRFAAGLLGCHVGRGAENRAGGSEALVLRIAEWTAAYTALFDRGEVFGQAPVDDDGLAKVADNDVGRLEVAVDDVAAVGVGDGVGDSD